MRWAEAELGNVDHEVAVARDSLRLFDLTFPIHRMTRWARVQLHRAAIVHDVGRACSDADHPRIGARMILRNKHLPLDEGSRRAVAYLTRRHRGRVPAPVNDPWLLPREHAGELLNILVLLRLADALHSRRSSPVEPEFERVGRFLLVRSPAGPAAIDKLASSRKLRLLKNRLGRQIAAAGAGRRRFAA